MQSGRLHAQKNSTAYFLNGHIGRQRTGIENAALQRARLFEQYLAVTPVICTVRYEPQFPEIRQLLITQGLITETLQFKNLYDELQGINSNLGLSEIAQLRLKCSLHPFVVEGRAEQLSGSPDRKIFDAKGRPIAFCKYSEDHGYLQHVNSLCEGRVWKRDVFHSSGMLSRTQFFDFATGFVQHEVYFNQERQIVLTKFYKPISGKISVANIVSHQNGSQCVEFLSEGELILHWLQGLVNQTEGQAIFCCDRIRLFAEPLLCLMAEHGPKSVAVIPVLHAVHTKLVNGIWNGPTNANFDLVLRDLKAFPAVVVGTQNQRLDLEARFKVTNIHAIPPGVFRHQATAVDRPRERFRVVYIARYTPEKRHRLAIEIFSRVHSKYADFRMDFYGWGDRMQQIIDDVNTRRLGHVISVNGFTQHPQSVYSAAGLSILTSQGEGFALGVLESLAASCPVVSFNVPYGPSDLIQDGHNGALIPEGDLDAFAQRIVQILSDGDLHHRLIQNCRSSIERFSEAAVAAQWRVLLQSASGSVTQFSDTTKGDINTF